MTEPVKQSNPSKREIIAKQRQQVTVFMEEHELRLDESEYIHRRKMPKLVLLKPNFRPGLNIALRPGRTWDMLIDRLPKTFDVVEREDEDTCLGSVVVIGKLVAQFDDLPEEILWRQAETISEEDVRKMYGRIFASHDEFTLLFFTLVPAAPSESS